MHAFRNLAARGCFAVLLLAALPGYAQAPLPLYTDHLVNGFQDWGWGTRNRANTSPVHSGTDSISLNGTAWNLALSLEHPEATSAWSGTSRLGIRPFMPPN